jgi:hypothetical protein
MREDGTANKAQLSNEVGVTSSVSSLAIDREMLSAAAASGTDLPTDAEVMLRVKAGDDGAFD